jgi:hypothetical protein
MRMPSFTAEASLGPATGSYRNTTIALTPTTSSMVTPAWIYEIDLLGKTVIDVSGGDCVSFCDAFGCTTCCWGHCGERSGW